MYLKKIRNLLSIFLKRKKVTLKELQSLLGLPGRTFLRRLIDLTIGLKYPTHRKRLNNEAKKDLQAWPQFIEHFNGKSVFLPDIWVNSATLDLFSDASNSGFGAYMVRRCLARIMETISHNSERSVSNSIKPRISGYQLQNQCIIFHCDNSNIVQVINKQTSKDFFFLIQFYVPLGEAKTGVPGEKPPDTPANRNWLVPHVTRVPSEPTAVR